jgi:hypothetical protein
VKTEIIVRLTKFHELNVQLQMPSFQPHHQRRPQIIRTIFRFIFVVPFVILGVDGVRPHKHINESMLWTGTRSGLSDLIQMNTHQSDFLIMAGSFGCCISSGLTLVVGRHSRWGGHGPDVFVDFLPSPYRGRDYHQGRRAAEETASSVPSNHLQ